MDKILKLISLTLALAFVLVACEITEDSESTHFEEKVSEQEDKDPPRILLTPDRYNSEAARNNGYTVIHEDTSTSADHERCGNGGARYSRNGQSACEIFSNPNDWYSSNRAVNTNCPNGFTRVDQAGIGRENLAGSTRQCRTTTKITTVDERAHYYCPHGPTLVGTRSGTAANRYGVCRFKCDSDTSHLFSSECGGSTRTTSATTSATTSTTSTTVGIAPDIPGHIPSQIPRTPFPTDPLSPTVPDFGDFNPGSLSISSAPDQTGIHIVGIETWFWIPPDKWSPVTKTMSQNGRNYEITAVPASLQILITGPAKNPTTKTIDCGNMPGSAVSADKTNCSYKWTNAGMYEITSKVRWSVSWICQPNCGAESLPSKTTRADGYLISVTEAQAIIVS